MSGKLFYLMGASGSGKDTLLQGCRQRLEHSHQAFIAHRYITRAADAGGENHIHLTESEFQLRVDTAMFAMHWASHGHLYGIGKEVEIWVKAGLNVIINGSREYLPIAMQQYDFLIPVMINIKTELLRDRLHKRGRETDLEIEKRLKRHADFLDHMPTGTMYIDNSGSKEKGIDALMDIITEHRFIR
ncbi:phosphonate metabolism protein/1,5-bisphosphokinase (PRPP-forming) PhnN [Neptuniibacter sp. QD48_11]|uniref:phosphonate metabolism protein/1,5-bisphosphokinase (PRPP-forming) PhnN n=1 Tax=unclassified Neptuniibacter TaxID=2630693 RepID=UPI0039F4AFCA